MSRVPPNHAGPAKRDIRSSHAGGPERNRHSRVVSERGEGFTTDRAWLAWFAVCLCAFVCWPYMMAAIYMPKLVWVSLTAAIGFLAVRPSAQDRSLTEKYRPTSLGTIWGQDAAVKVLRKFATAPYPAWSPRKTARSWWTPAWMWKN